MAIDRRKFFKVAAAGCGSAACAAAAPVFASSGGPRTGADGYGMLQDSVRCIGCKACQTACKSVNKLAPEASLKEDYYDSPRELSDTTYTLIQMEQNRETGEATFVKKQCLHCIDPACQSACLVGALKKQQNGAVTWDGDKCMGCRYCMVACPYNVPQFQWKEAIPDISKCTLCAETRLKNHQPTGCAGACPADAISFGKRGELLRIARQRIAASPALYLDHIYGEQEVGGTNVLYLTKKSVAFAALGLGDFGFKAPPRLTEGIQHGVFKYFIPPLAIYAALGGVMAFTARKNRANQQEGGSHE
jgi:Fe-S-cluster-containing dehydrogenase component